MWQNYHFLGPTPLPINRVCLTPWRRRPLSNRRFGHRRFGRDMEARKELSRLALANFTLSPTLQVKRGRRHQGVSPFYRPSHRLRAPIFCAGWRCRTEKFCLRVSILQWKCAQQDQHRASKPSSCVQQPVSRQRRCGQHADTVSCAQLPRMLHCRWVSEVVWAHCRHA